MNRKKKREQSKKDNRIGCAFLIISFSAIIPLTYSGREYNVTFIPFIYLIIGSLLVGFIVSIILNKTIQRVENLVNFQLRYFLLVSIICGSYFSSIFFLSNIYLSKSEVYSIETPIIAKLESWKYHHVYIRVNVNGFVKDIPIPEKEISEIENYNSIILTFDKGFWNFPFVVDKILKP